MHEENSAAQIANVLGITRNAVIGKALRIGLAKPRPVSLNPRRKRVGERGKDGAAASAIANRSRKKAKWSEKSRRRHFRKDWAILQQQDKDIPADQRRSLVELTQHTCRWPVGDPCKPDFFFCGAPSDNSHGRPYCHAHTSRSLSDANT